MLQAKFINENRQHTYSTRLEQFIPVFKAIIVSFELKTKFIPALKVPVVRTYCIKTKSLTIRSSEMNFGGFMLAFSFFFFTEILRFNQFRLLPVWTK